MRRPLLFFISLACFFTPTSASAQEASYLQSLIQRSRTQNLAQDRYWRLLGHYHRTRWGILSSESNDPEFFLARNGRRDPQAELEATLKGFFSEDPADPEEMHPVCKFPARFSWLKEKLRIDTTRLKKRDCPRFAEWKQKLNPQAVTLVFASAFLSNPGSMYGHTFLRFDRKDLSRGERLLDYSLNFSAMISRMNILTYIPMGLAGGYEGRYSAMPYYVKVQEYANLESRDLWEYRLNLSSHALNRLVEHTWEMGSASFPYYFLNKNCSYQLLPLLEVADPRLDITPHLAAYVIPAETVRWVYDIPGLVKSVDYRPSQTTLMTQRRALLDRHERKIAAEIARGDFTVGLKELGKLKESRRSLVLDAASEFILYLSGPQKKAKEGIGRREQRVLVKRGKLKALPTEITRPAHAVAPHRGHKSSRWGFGVGANDRSPYEEFSWRLALQDLLDPQRAYVPNSQLETVGPLRVRHDNKSGTTYVHQWEAISISAISPWDNWTRPLSWNIRSGYAVAQELNDAPWNSRFWRLGGGLGFAYATDLGAPAIHYAFAQADTGLAAAFHKGYRVGGGGRLGSAWDLHRRWRLWLEGEYLGYIAGERTPRYGIHLGQSFEVYKDFTFRFMTRIRRTHREVSLTAYLHL